MCVLTSVKCSGENLRSGGGGGSDCRDIICLALASQDCMRLQPSQLNLAEHQLCIAQGEIPKSQFCNNV